MGILYIGNDLPRSFRLVLVSLLSLWSLSGLADPFSFSYSGRISNAQGIPAEGPVTLEIKFFNAASGGKQVGPTKVLPDVVLNHGVFQAEVTLSGTERALVFTGKTDVWLETTDATAGKSYPRQKLHATPFAMKVPVDDSTLGWTSNGQLTVLPGASVSKIDGTSVDASGATNGQVLTWNNTTSTWEPTNIGSTSIANESIGADKLAPNSVDVSELNDGLCIDNQILKKTGGTWACGSDAGGAGSYVQTVGDTLGTDMIVGTDDAFDLQLRAGGVNRITVDDATGNVGIGTSNPVSNLDIRDADVGTEVRVVNTTSTGSRWPGFSAYNFANGTGGLPMVNLYNAQGSEGAESLSTTNQELGAVKFNGHSGSGWETGAQIRGLVEADFSVGNHPTALTFHAGPTGSPAERLRISSAGNVGIGTTAPNAKLDIDQGNLRLTNAADGYVEFDTDGGVGNVTLTLPTSGDGNNMILKSDGAGNLSWAADATGGAPDFGSITAGTNNSVAMTVDTGGSIVVANAGTVEATKYKGSGSTTDDIDLGTAEVVGTLAASKIDAAIARDTEITYKIEGDLTGALDDNYVEVTGDTMSGPLAMGNSKITGLGTPTVAADAATMGYVDGEITALGLGSIATQDANSVSITGGAVSGITDLAIADGGTGASTATGAINGLLPAQGSNSGKFLTTDGTNTSWATASGDPSYGSGGSSPIDAVFVDNAGNTGIGTTAPDAPLDVHSSTNSGTRLELTNADTGGKRWQLISSGSAGVGGAGDLLFYNTTNSIYALSIDGGGNVGIGSTGPQAPLEVLGSPNISGDSRTVVSVLDDTPFAAGVGGGVNLGGYYAGASKTTFGFLAGIKENGTASNYAGALVLGSRPNGSPPAEAMRIDSAGNVGIGTSNPGAKLHIGGGAPMTTELSPSLEVNISDTTDTGAVALTLGVYEGVNNPRAQFFVDDANNTYGLRSSASVTRPDFVLHGNAGAEIVRIANDGDVGIGTAGPNEKLEVMGAISLQDSQNPGATAGRGKIYVKADGDLYYKNSAGIESKLTGGSTTLPKDYYEGLDLEFTSTTSITISAGSARSDDDSDDLVLGSDQVVQISCSGINCLDAGSTRTTNTWYAVYLVKGASGVGGLISQDITPTLPAGYNDAKKRLGWIRTNASGSGNVRNFSTTGGKGARLFNFVDTTISMIDIKNQTNSSTYTNLNNYVPPGINHAHMGLYMYEATLAYMYFAAGGNTGVAFFDVETGPGYEFDSYIAPIEIDIDGSNNRRINAWTSKSLNTGTIYVYGWYDDLR